MACTREVTINMSENVTKKEVVALAIMTKHQLVRYANTLENFLNAKIISEELIDDVISNAEELNEYLPQIQFTYFSETLAPLRKARGLLILLAQRQKREALSNPRLDLLFKLNLHVINDFLTRFNLSEELSTANNTSSSYSDEEIPLYQRIINPNADNSKDFRTTIKEMARTAQSTKESNANWKNLADSIKREYETLDYPIDNGVIAISELFLEGVSALVKRDAEYQLSERKTQQLSEVPLTKEEGRKKNIDNMLNQISESIIRE